MQYMVIDAGLSATASNNIFLASSATFASSTHGILTIGGSGLTGWVNAPNQQVGPNAGTPNGNAIAATGTTLSPNILFEGIRNYVKTLYNAGTPQVWYGLPTAATNTDFGLNLQQQVGQTPFNDSIPYLSNPTGSVTQASIVSDWVTTLNALGANAPFQLTAASLASGANTFLQVTALAGSEVLKLGGSANWTITNLVTGVARQGYGADLQARYGIQCTTTNSYNMYEISYYDNTDSNIPGANVLSGIRTFYLFLNQSQANVSAFMTGLDNVLSGGTTATADTTIPGQAR